jgi:hypothetical protein
LVGWYWYWYSQTGAGKTYTMLGNVARWQIASSGQKMLRGEEEGLIPRAVRHLFQLIDGKADVQYDIRCSFVELHRDAFSDLLDTQEAHKRPKIEIRQKGTRVFLAGSASLRTPIKSLQDALRIVADGQQRRKLAATKLNDQSSRSHAILTFYIESRQLAAPIDSAADSYGKLHLIDLAGHEVCSDTAMQLVLLAPVANRARCARCVAPCQILC